MTSKSKIIVLFLCALGFIYQARKLSIEYFAYDVTTEVSVDFDEFVSYPNISLCIYISDVFNYTQDDLKSLGIDNISNFDEAIRKLRGQSYTMKVATSSKIMANRTISELLSQTLSWRDMFRQCSSFNSSSPTFKMTYTPDCSHLFNITESITDYNKCYRFGQKNQVRKTTTKEALRRITLPGYMASIYIKKELFRKLQEVSLFLNSGNQLASSETGFSLILSPLNLFFRLSFSETVSYSLPAPYVTDCFNYRLEGFENQSDCFLKCLKSKALTATGRIPKGMAITNGIDSKYRMMTLSELSANKSLRNSMERIEMTCEKSCSRQDCESVNVSPEFITKSSYNYNVFAFFSSYSAKITSISWTERTLLEFMSQLCECIGFWISFSIFNLFYDVQFFFNHAKRCCQ